MKKRLVFCLVLLGILFGISHPLAGEILGKIPYGPKSAEAFSSSGNKAGAAGPQGPVAMRFSVDGHLWVLDAGYARLVELSPLGGWLKAVDIPAPIAEISWSDFVPIADGSFFLLEKTSGGVYFLEAGSGALKKVLGDLEFARVSRLIPDRMDSICVLDITEGERLLRIASDGVGIGTASGTGLQGSVDVNGRFAFQMSERTAERARIRLLPIEPEFSLTAGNAPTVFPEYELKRQNPRMHLTWAEVLGSDAQGRLYVFAVEGDEKNSSAFPYVACFDTHGILVKRIDVPSFPLEDVSLSPPVVLKEDGTLVAYGSDGNLFFVHELKESPRKSSSEE